MSAGALRSISVGGDALHARFVVALLGTALAPHGCRVGLGELTNAKPPTKPVILGPIVRRALDGVGIADAPLWAAGALQRFHWELPRMNVWSTPFGLAQGGVDFHQHLHRIEGALSYDSILPFNPAARLGARMEAHGPIKQPPVPFGFHLARGKMLALLEALPFAEAISASTADLAITVMGNGSAEWDGREVCIPTDGAFPELGPYRCVTSVERLLGLLPGREETPAQAQEFNRLSLAEEERIGDFAALMVGDFSRPAVARKRDVFAAFGRIPVEDYEVIPPHYWMSVFLQQGIEPADYDRLADRFPREDIAVWIETLRRQMEQLERGA